MSRVPSPAVKTPITKTKLIYFYGVNDKAFMQQFNRFQAWVKLCRDNGGVVETTECDTPPGNRHNSWRAAFTEFNAFAKMLGVE
jgi:hypothetical protein